MMRPQTNLLMLTVFALALFAAGAIANSEKSCKELGFSNQAGNDDVCSQTDLPGLGCNRRATWQEARNMCRGIGARLCTRAELIAKEGRESTDTCNFKRKIRVWTNNRCDNGVGRWAARLNNGSGRQCLDRNDSDETAAVVCCADAIEGDSECSIAQTATYRVSFSSDWVENPRIGSEHFTAIVGWAHDGSDEGRLWIANEGIKSTRGLEDLAEMGLTSRILNELDDLEDEGHVLDPERKTGDLFTPFRNRSWEITVDRDHPWASHVSMIAPSPDWFIGNNENLLNDDGTWVESRRRDWGTYDAGTEDGERFSLSNSATRPQEPITTLRIPLENGAGTIRFERISCQ